MSGLLAKLTGKSHNNDDNTNSNTNTNTHTNSGSSSSTYTNSSGHMAPTASTTTNTTTTTTEYDQMNRGAAGNTQYNTNAGTDTAITRSEEQLRVGKERVSAGAAALDKYVTTEHVQTSVPVTKERVVIEREPITDANRDAALAGPEISEAHHEVHLTEERAVASKETVPIERIRLGKQVEVHEQQVGAELRKEHVDLTTTGVNEKFDNIGYGKTTGTPLSQTTTNETNVQGRTAPKY